MNDSKTIKKSQEVLNIIETLFEKDEFNEILEYSHTSVVTGSGFIGDKQCLSFIEDFQFDNGATDPLGCDKIEKLYNMARTLGIPVVGFYHSFGGKIDTQFATFNGIANALSMSSHLSGVVPQISVITGTAISTKAMLALQADFIIMTKEAKLALHFDALETNSKNLAHFVVEDVKEAILLVQKLIYLLPQNNIEIGEISSFEYFEKDEILQDNLDNMEEYHSDKVVEFMLDENSQIEISKHIGKNSKVYLGKIDGVTTGVIAFENKIDSLIDLTKVARMVKIFDSFSLPVITIINSNGLENFGKDEEALKEMVKLSTAYADATTCKITLVTGRCIGNFSMAFIGKNQHSDMTIAWTKSVLSPLPPEAYVHLMWKDRLLEITDVKEDTAKLIFEYETTLASPYSAAKEGLIDSVIDPYHTRVAIKNALSTFMNKKELEIPRKHSNITL